MAPLRRSRTREPRVGYHGEAHAPVPGTYIGINPFGFFALEDSGLPTAAPELRRLAPLIAAALYETGFAWEAGPLTTWSN